MNIKPESHRAPVRRMIITACILAGICVAGLLLVFTLSGYIKRSTQPYIFDLDTALSDDCLPETDCIMVLGCGVDDYGRPKLMLRDRLSCGVELYQEGIAPKLLMSGDHGRVTYDEVNAMKTYLSPCGARGYTAR